MRAGRLGMVRVVWSALVWWALADVVGAGFRFADYSGPKMHQYGVGMDYERPRDPPTAAPEDYVDQDHPSDTLASPSDYAYDDDSENTNQTPINELEESGEWHNKSKIPHKRPLAIDDNISDSIDLYDTEYEIPKLKPGHRVATRRPKKKRRNQEFNDKAERLPATHGRSRIRSQEFDGKDDINSFRTDTHTKKGLSSDDDLNLDIHIRRDDANVRKRLDLDDFDAIDDIYHRHKEPHRKGPAGDDADVKERFYMNRDELQQRRDIGFADDKIDRALMIKPTTVRAVRWKAKERFLRRQFDEKGDDELLQRKMGTANRLNLDHSYNRNPKNYGKLTFITGPSNKRGDDTLVKGDLRTTLGPREDDQDDVRVTGKQRQNHNFNDSEDYSYDMVRVAGIRERLPELQRRSSTARSSSNGPVDSVDTPNIQNTTLMQRRNIILLPVINSSGITIGPTSRNSSQTTAPAIITKGEDPSTTSISDCVLITESPGQFVVTGLTVDMDIEGTGAPRRQSKYESVKIESWNTHSSTDSTPWIQATVGYTDSPETLRKVKRYMRQKLLQNAESIRDLTENWDEMVCEDIDIRLFANSSDKRSSNWLLLLTMILICKCV